MINKLVRRGLKFQSDSSIVQLLRISPKSQNSRDYADYVAVEEGTQQQHGTQNRKHLLKKEVYERWLTGKISRCDSLSELQMMVTEDGWQFSPINLSAAFVRVTRIKEASPGQVTNIISKMVGFLTSEMIEKMNPQSLANTVWTLAKTKYGKNAEGQSILKALVLRCEALVDIFPTQNIANVVWAMATCNLKDEIALRSFALAALEKREYLKVQELSNILWAMGVLRLPEEELIRRFIAVASDKIHELNSQNLGNIVWAMGTLRYYDEKFLDSIEEMVLNEEMNAKMKENFSSLAAVQVIGACATLNYQSKPLLKWMLQHIGPPKEQSLQGLVNVMYYWAVLDQSLLQIQHVCSEIVSRYKKNAMDFRDIHYRQFWFASTLFGTKLEVVNIPDKLRNVAQARWNEVLENPVVSDTCSDRVKDVSESLRDLGFRSIVNYKLKDRPIRSDLAINVKGTNIAIFVNGQLRYTLNQPLRKLGNIIAMQRIIESAEWKIMDIPWHEWDEIFESSAKEEYLEKKMMEAVADKDVTF
eukprot:TRINITY_DN4137_c0_g2_i1.p1 TRINITY_DN4137_c0_g2~~TRINITY_DN4137_c0_g2_i1.p1  ORF type:complete len:530 (-),score=52.88 TRINITY_DN4137_c0_g2_i1:274-1863(-)